MLKYIIFAFFLGYMLYEVSAQANCRCQPIIVGNNTGCYQSLSSDGGGTIDPRIVNGNSAVTGGTPGASTPGGGTATIPVTPPSGTTTTSRPGQTLAPLPPIVTTCPGGQEQCCSGLTGCGVRWDIPVTPATTPPAGHAKYGSQPWQAAILGIDNTTVAGGVLIDSVHVLTVAHRIFNRTAASIKVRLGEWDSNRAVETYPPQESLVIQIRNHAGFNEKNLQNDISILRLATPIQVGPTPNPAINTACLPAVNTVFDNLRCFVAGWGKDAFTGSLQSIIKVVDVPVIANGDCQTKLQKTRLGPTFVLNTTTFICAGGERDRDSCVGDGGSALICNIGSKYQIAGLVSWGIGCGTQDVPGVYVKVQNYLQWIQQNTV